MLLCNILQSVVSLYRKCQSSSNPEGARVGLLMLLSEQETNMALNSSGITQKEMACFLEAGAHRYLGEAGGLENTSELRGDWRLKEREGEVEVGDTLRGLLRSPLWSFQISSSFSIDRRLFTLDSF